MQREFVNPRFWPKRHYSKERQENKERYCPEWLIGCKQANEKEDRRGIDFWFKTKDVGNIRIQVKSSMKGVEEAKKHHPKIPVVRLPPVSSEDSLFRECLGVVEQERIKYLRERSR